MSSTLLLMPGPTNTLLLFSGATSGLIKTQKLILAEIIGYFVAISLWGYMIYTLAAQMLGVMTAIRVLSAVYILYLSHKIWKFQQGDIDTARIRSTNVLFTTLCNPKALVLAMYILPSETFRSLAVYPFTMLVFFATLIPVSVIWSCAGYFGFHKDKSKPILKPVYFYRLASAILCVFSASILYNAISSV